MTAAATSEPVGLGALSVNDALALGDRLFIDAIITVLHRLQRSILVGLCGPQGSGKSTTAAGLAALLRKRGLGVEVCSLDDFYLTHAERQDLAARVHPLFQTRGVPGTHDVALMGEVVSTLLNAGTDSSVVIPRFDKTKDDRVGREAWNVHSGRADVVLLEGWCVGARAEVEETLAIPVNELERVEDASQTWRRYANMRLGDDYADLFARMDLTLMLRAPSFECVYEWRAEQERGLARRSSDAARPMGKAALARFISHYERITRRLLVQEPADLIADLNANRAHMGWRAMT